MAIKFWPERVNMTDETDPTSLAYLNEDNAIRILVNETEEKFVAKDWLIGDGRAANTILAKQILGTTEGLQGSADITVDDDCLGVFDTMLLWLLLGDAHLQASLTEENASLIYKLADYFGLEALKSAIEAEQKQRDEDEAKRVAAEIRKRAEQAAFDRMMAATMRILENRAKSAGTVRHTSAGKVRCTSCGEPTTVAPNYRGNTPRCWDCRDNDTFDNDYDYFSNRDYFSDDSY